MVKLHVKFKRITIAATRYRIFCLYPCIPLPTPPPPPPPTLKMGSIGQNSTFLEHGHVADQIKGKHECKYFARRSPNPTLGMRSISQNSTFQNMFMLHIRLNGITNYNNMVANILPIDLWVKIQLFQNMVMLHIKFM